MNKPFVPSDPARPAHTDRPDFLRRDEEARLARAWRDHGDVAARNRLVTAFTPLVLSIAKRHSRARRLDDPDLVQQAHIGLLKAADGFDPDRGFRFATYAAWWVRAELQEYRLSTWSLVARGRSARARKAFFNLPRLEEATEWRPGETPRERDARIAADLGVNMAELDRMRRQFGAQDSSLNIAAADGEGDEIINLLPDPEADVEADVATRHDREVLQRNLTHHFRQLPERERDIVIATVLRDPPMTLNELGESYGISRERVRQLRERGLGRLREFLAEDAAAATELS